jgi:hypothetical protein
MGWLEGVLTGYAQRHYDIENTKREEAAKAAEREGRVFETLLNSRYKDIQEYAAAGLLDLSNPRKRKGGVAGWMGEIEQTPYLDMVRRTQQRINEDPEYAQANLVKNAYPWLGQGAGTDVATPPPEAGGAPPVTPSVPTPAGQVAPAAPGAPPAALPSTSAVTGGPVTPPRPAPSAPASQAPPKPPAPGMSIDPGFRLAPNQYRSFGGRPGVVGPVYPMTDDQLRGLGGQPGSQDPGLTQTPAGAAGPPAAAAASAPPATAAPPTLAAPPTPPSAAAAGANPPPPPPSGLPSEGLPGATTRAVGGTPILRSRTELPGIFPTVADTQRAQAQAAVSGKIEGYAEMYRAQGYSEPEAQARAAKLFEQDLLSGSSGLSNTYTPGPITPDPESPTGYMQTYLNRSNPSLQFKVASQAPAGRNSLVSTYQRQWNAIQAPVRAMELNLRNMISAYRRYTANPADKTAWEPLRIAFLHTIEPNSVVMPTEFARQVGVLSLKEMAYGQLGKLLEGGAPMELPEVQQLMRTALQMWQGVQTYGAQQRSAIEAAIDAPNLLIPHEQIFGSEPRFDPGDMGLGGLGSTDPSTPPPPPPGTGTPKAGSNFVQDPITKKWEWK